MSARWHTVGDFCCHKVRLRRSTIDLAQRVAAVAANVVQLNRRAAVELVLNAEIITLTGRDFEIGVDHNRFKEIAVGDVRRRCQIARIGIGGNTGAAHRVIRVKRETV